MGGVGIAFCSILVVRLISKLQLVVEDERFDCCARYVGLLCMLASARLHSLSWLLYLYLVEWFDWAFGRESQAHTT